MLLGRRKEVAFVLRLVKGTKFIHSINLDEKQPKRIIVSEKSARIGLKFHTATVPLSIYNDFVRLAINSSLFL